MEGWNKTCIAATIIGTVLMILFVCTMRTSSTIVPVKRNMLAAITKSYPDRHWKNKVSKSCMNCRHISFITKHWGKSSLYCENCKSVHKGKLTKHYMYDEAINCIQCGHNKTIPHNHEEAGINCVKCKTNHWKHYSDNVLQKK